jgi:hypothetical protein
MQEAQTDGERYIGWETIVGVAFRPEQSLERPACNAIPPEGEAWGPIIKTVRRQLLELFLAIIVTLNPKPFF